MLLLMDTLIPLLILSLGAISSGEGRGHVPAGSAGIIGPGAVSDGTGRVPLRAATVMTTRRYVGLEASVSVAGRDARRREQRRARGVFRPIGFGPEAAWSDRPAYSGSGFSAFAVHGARLADRGVAALFVKLPYYGERRPPGRGRRRSGFSPQTSSGRVTSMRQAVCDVRRAAVWLATARRSTATGLGVTGISLGGIVSSLAAAVDPAIREGASCSPAATCRRSSGRCPRARPYRGPGSQSGRTLTRSEGSDRPFRSADLCEPAGGQTLLMIAGKVDEVVPPASTLLLWEAAGRPPIRWYDCGHYSAVGYLLPGIRQTVDFFAVTLMPRSRRFRLSEIAVGVNLPELHFASVILSSRREGVGMTARVTSVFLYVKDVRRSLEFYNEVVGAEIVQVHAEQEGAPYSLAILRIGHFTLMLHPQEPHADEFTDTRVGVGIHLQLQVPDVDAFYQHCMDEGAILSVSGEPADQSGAGAIRPPRPRRLCLVDLPGQVGWPVDHIMIVSRTTAGASGFPGAPHSRPAWSLIS